jgi:hypothetical protein
MNAARTPLALLELAITSSQSSVFSATVWDALSKGKGPERVLERASC